MSSDPVWCTESDDVSYVMELMKTHQLRRIPVVNDKHEVVGIMSVADLARHDSMRADQIAEVIRSISEPARETQKRIDRLITAA